MTTPIPDPDELKDTLSLSSTPIYVATGGFKAVFKISLPDGTPEALKAVHIPKANPDNDDELLHREQLIARAKREIAALGECSHPGIVKLGHLSPTDASCSDHDYLVYSEEFLSGESLAAWLRAGRASVPFQDLYEVMWSLVDLIESLSALGYLHRDIKPDNIMDTGVADRRFVVLDMGIAYKMHGTELTRGSGPPGTLRYMAPELLRPDYKDNMDFRCDLYSAALTVYVLAAKAHPFAPQPEAAYATVYRITNTSPSPLHSLRPDLPESFCRIIDRCIRKKAALRYNNLATLKSDLEGTLK